MTAPSLASAWGHRVMAKGRRWLASHLECQHVPLSWSRPVISFTFDDAPSSAFQHGGDIVANANGHATYYCSMGLLNASTEVGPIASLGDLQSALDQGHELGCHTYDHLDAWHTPTAQFMGSIERNAIAFQERLGLQPLQSFAYPKSGARWAVKAQVGPRFLTCRGGAQSVNHGTADLRLLKACFLDLRAGWSLSDLQTLIDDNQRHKGWLIFATHDVTQHPSPYGCTPHHLKEVVRRSTQSGARLLSMTEAWHALMEPQSSH